MSYIANLWQRIDSRFIRFVFVGVLNTAFGYGVYCLMIWLGLSYWWATLVANVLGVLFNFKTIGVLVFENPNNRLFFRFASCYALGYGLNVGVIWLLTHNTAMNEYWSGMLATVCVALFCFFYQKLFVFNRRDNEK